MKTVKDISATIFGILYPWVKFYIVYFWKNFRVFVDVYDFVKISFKSRNFRLIVVINHTNLNKK